MRKCKICKNQKQESEMITKRNRCKSCHAEQQRKWRKTPNGKSYMRNTQKKRKQVRFRDKVLSKCKCIICGNTNKAVLEFDHIDPSTKLFNISYMVKRCMTIKAIKIEMRKCQVLCSNCHIEKTKLDNHKYN